MLRVVCLLAIPVTIRNLHAPRAHLQVGLLLAALAAIEQSLFSRFLNVAAL